MPDLEAIGDAATGAVIVRALEPQSGQADGHTNEPNCLNCGAELRGNYCQDCGQRRHVHRTIAAWWHDFVHSVLHLDGKFWRTLPLLAWRPGELTRRYAHGERAKFVSPLALFLFSVFLMFAVFSLLGGPFDLSGTPAEDRAEARADLAEARRDAQRNLAELNQKLRQARMARQPTADIEARMLDERAELAMEEQAYRFAMRVAADDEQREAKQNEDGTASETSADQPQMNIGDTGWKPLDDAIQKAERNPSLLFYKVQANAYKFSWALIPLSLPFIWSLFLHRRRYRRDYGAYDHLVFITYSIAFMTLGGIVLALLRPLGTGGTLIGMAATFIPPIHMYRQLRGAYQLSRWSAVWRTFVLLIFSFVTLTLFMLLLLVLGVFG